MQDNDTQQQAVETVMSDFTINYFNSLHMCAPDHMIPVAATCDRPYFLNEPCISALY